MNIEINYPKNPDIGHRYKLGGADSIEPRIINGQGQMLFASEDTDRNAIIFSSDPDAMERIGHMALYLASEMRALT